MGVVIFQCSIFVFMHNKRTMPSKYGVDGVK